MAADSTADAADRSQLPVPQNMVNANEQALRESRESVWFLKSIVFQAQTKKIITQNYNGPCSFIAICNILILRGDIEILPPERTSVSYEFLSQLVGEYLLRASPDTDLSAALTMMPLTQKGMDLNPLFTSHQAFRPVGDAGALKLFEQARIQLVHGWLVDPGSPESRVLSASEDYDNTVNLIVVADDIMKGQFVVDDASASAEPGPSSSGAVAGPSNVNAIESLSPEEQQKVEAALVARNFLDTTSSQLTYHGLFTLVSALPPGALVALFRNSHLSVLYKRPRPIPKQDRNANSDPEADPEAVVHSESNSNIGANGNGNTENACLEEEDSALYSLVTDFVFLHESSVVWERLEDVEGGMSSFVDSEFRRSSPAGGDFAGHTAESALRAMEAEEAANAPFDPADQELARQLQAEEDAQAHEIYERRRRDEFIRRQQQEAQQNIDSRDPRNQQQQGSGRPAGQHISQRPPKMKKDKSCVIM